MNDDGKRIEPIARRPVRRRGNSMRISEESKYWVVYQMTVHGKHTGGRAVCEQREWEAMERLQPGHHVLIQAGIGNESEAEKLARNYEVDANIPVGKKS